MTLVCYTDASYCSQSKVAACGFTVYNAWQLIKHEITIIGDTKNVKQAEHFAIEQALRYCFESASVTEVVVYTDQIVAVEKWNVHGRNKAYKGISKIAAWLIEKNVSVELKYVKAHDGNLLHNIVDKSCRRALRRYKNKYVENKKGIKPIWSSMYPKGRRSA